MGPPRYFTKPINHISAWSRPPASLLISSSAPQQAPSMQLQHYIMHYKSLTTNHEPLTT